MRSSGRSITTFAAGVLLAATSAVGVASPGCDAINAMSPKLEADAKRVGSFADTAQAIDCLAVGFAGGCFGRVRDVTKALDAKDTSTTYDLAAGDTIEFRLTTTALSDIARIVAYEQATSEIIPLEGRRFRATHPGTFKFELAVTGASGHAATARAICTPSTS